MWILQSSWLDHQVTLVHFFPTIHRYFLRHVLKSDFSRCSVTVCRCAQLELQDCTLRELCLSIQRDGEPLDTPFVCRVGEITVSSKRTIGAQISPVFNHEGFRRPLRCSLPLKSLSNRYVSRHVLLQFKTQKGDFKSFFFFLALGCSQSTNSHRELGGVHL